MKKLFVTIVMIMVAVMLTACHSARDGKHNGFEVGVGLLDLDLGFVYIDLPDQVANPNSQVTRPIYVERLVSSGNSSVEENRSIVVNNSENTAVTYYESNQPDPIIIYTPPQHYGIPYSRRFWNW